MVERALLDDIHHGRHVDLPMKVCDLGPVIPLLRVLGFPSLMLNPRGQLRMASPTYAQ